MLKMGTVMIQRNVAVPPKLADDTQKINLIVSRAWLDELDKWRKRQDGPLSTRSDAIRKIVEQVMRADASGDKPKPAKKGR
jgi:hypothetical protein